MTTHPPVDWTKLDQPIYDRVVEALFVRHYQKEWDITVLNGRGGDAGIDILGERSGRRKIWQLKFFPEGFSGAHTKRRTQIQKSFNAMLKHEPTEWVLVIPANPSPSEHAFVAKLDAGDQEIKRDIKGRAFLDALVSQYDDIQRFLLRGATHNDILAAASLALLDPKSVSDLDQRINHVKKAAEGLDPHWDIDFFRSGDSITYIPRPKHPQAQDIAPIHLKATLSLSDEGDELRERLKAMTEFGIRDSISIPGRLMDNPVLEGPEFLHGLTPAGELAIQPAGPEPKHVPSHLRYLSASGETLGAYHGYSQMTIGTKGHQLIFVADCGVTLRFFVPEDREGDRITGKLVGNPAGQLPDTYAASAQMILATYSSHRVELWAEAEMVLATSAAGDISEEELLEVRALRQAARDLAYIQQETRTVFAMPLELTTHDRLTIRTVALMLQGKRVQHPTLTEVTIEEVVEGARERLQEEEMHAVLFQSPSPTETIAGKEIELPSIVYYSPAVESKPIKGQPGAAALETLDSARFTIYMPERLPPTQSNDPLPLTPWNVQGITEPVVPRPTT